MLIEFEVENFRSIRDRQSFSMAADTQQHHAETNTFDPELSALPRLLRSGVVFGANAAGKTNLLRALQYMKNFVVSSVLTSASTDHEHTPFLFDPKTKKKPSIFKITFTHDGKWYEYEFSVDSERVLFERLVEHIHARGRDLFIRRYSRAEKKYIWKFSSFLKGQKSSWSEQTRKNALFLSTASQLNSTQLLPVYSWFQHKLVVIVGAVGLNETLTLRLLQQPNGKERILPFLREADLGIADIEVERQPLPSRGAVVGGNNIMLDQRAGASAPHLVKVSFTHTWGSHGEQAPLDFEDESSGTQALFKSAGAYLNVLANGEVFLIDEIDTSLHPLLVRFIIQKFHSSKSNPLNAQLIFNTHDVTLLDLQIFRRDQVWFVDKGIDGASRIYPLSDFRIRQNEHIFNWYLKGKYGALPILSEDRD